MKTPEQFLTDVERRLTSTWADSAAATALDATDTAWPKAFTLGKVTATEAESGFAAVAAQVQTWRDWAMRNEVSLTWQARRLLGTSQQIPTQATVTSAEHAAHLCGGRWATRLERARARGTHLAGRYPHLAQPVRSPAEHSDADGQPQNPTLPKPRLVAVLRGVDAMTDIDFDLLGRAGDWFAANDAAGLTPRQVPIEGLHAKWLNSGTHLVRELADRNDLGLLPEHPARIHFTYLDPQYRASGARIHDSATVGDAAHPAYQPQLVIISENKDTALHFPTMPGAISVEGVGRGGRTIASLPWLVHAPRVIYWGDMDADGLEILNEFRAVGVPSTSILMDPSTYQAWSRFGTDTDARNRTLGPRPVKSVEHLTLDERALYTMLCAPSCLGPRRVEQERIPFSVAMAAISRLP